MKQQIITPRRRLLISRDSQALQLILEYIQETVSGKQILVLAGDDDSLARRLAPIAADTAAVFSEDVRKFEVQQPFPANLHFLRADYHALPFCNAAFDAVISADTLHRIPNADTAMQEIIRVMKPDGVLIAPACVHRDMTVNHTLADLALRRTIAWQPARRWTKNSYIAFLHQYGWHIRKGQMVRTAPPFFYAYAECIRKRSAE